MKATLTLFAVGGFSVLATPALFAQANFAANNATNVAANSTSSSATATNAQIQRSAGATANEQMLLPPGLKEKLKLTDAQRTQLKPIEADFARTSLEYKAANQPRIEAAQEANRQARVAKDLARIQAARTQWQQVWAGLQPYRTTAVTKIKPLLTPDQLKVLELPQNQWREDYPDEAKNPTAK